MGLADLKNTSKQRYKKTKLISIDEFINGAEFYAKGLSESLARQPELDDKVQTSRRFKPCTYTLDQTACESLAEMSEQYAVSKSKLIRILLRNMVAMGDVERSLVLTLYQDD